MSNHIDIVNAMYVALPKQDFETFAKHTHPDFAVVEADSLPFAGTFSGMEGFTQLVTKVFEMFSEFEPNVKAMAAGDDTVMVWIDMKLTGRESGKTINVPMIEVFSFEGDKVKQITPFYYDTDAINAIV
ncbi:conserved hypothetical protein [Luminiphilus syltensis NOR5-1B]|uniref:SnoaL-like domain-containing protein n=1 Tax=Luminiphilus syltensis NOR5-1B TaxID=565045 RepID=B8KQE9_9GAMM|nr:conserved hypothetical protein [Luminiphilus syltensis NOR5-1B]